MKLNEFEARLSSVSDGKLRLMYADCREKGPAVAVDLILAEAGRRGLDLDAGVPAMTAASAGETADGLAPDTGLDAAAGEGAAPKGAWLAEETASGGMPAMVKILLAIVILGGLAVAAFLVLGRG